MSTHRDPLFESLDRLAGLADDDTRGERMPDIHRRVRQTRRRRATGAAVAAAVLAVGGVGIWQALPTDHKTEIVTPHATQEIALQAEDRGDGTVAVTFTVIGRSTTYTDVETGEVTGYAGPRTTEVLVDGKSVTGSDGGDIECTEAGTLKSYEMSFFGKRPYLAHVGLGRHTVEVRAPYCDEGNLVDDSTQVVVTAVSVPRATETLEADVDGDGTDDVIVFVEQPMDDGTSGYSIDLHTATGGAATPVMPLPAESKLQTPIDLDGDGDLEIIVSFSGGEAYWAEVYTLRGGTLVQLETRDAFGGDTLSGAGVEPTDWHLTFLPDGIYSWRFADPADTARPASVEVRSWTLDGRTLSESDQSTQGCVDTEFALTLGAC